MQRTALLLLSSGSAASSTGSIETTEQTTQGTSLVAHVGRLLGEDALLLLRVLEQLGDRVEFLDVQWGLLLIGGEKLALLDSVEEVVDVDVYGPEGLFRLGMLAG